jgi:hypothetical protein
VQDLRKKLRSLRFLMWFALLFAIFGYVIKPLRSAFWKPVKVNEACQKLQHGQKAFDRWGNELSYDRRMDVARSAGPDGKPGTEDDVIIGCME